jgi:hypothetical protein
MFTFTNALVALNSAIFVTVGNTGANDAQMTITRVTPAVGSFKVTCVNNGTQALNGTVSISFMIFN